jgi:hypothetical protein
VKKDLDGLGEYHLAKGEMNFGLWLRASEYLEKMISERLKWTRRRQFYNSQLERSEMQSVGDSLYSSRKFELEFQLSVGYALSISWMAMTTESP